MRKRTRYSLRLGAEKGVCQNRKNIPALEDRTEYDQQRGRGSQRRAFMSTPINVNMPAVRHKRLSTAMGVCQNRRNIPAVEKHTVMVQSCNENSVGLATPGLKAFTNPQR